MLAKVSYLALLNGPIFQAAYVESALPLETPRVYSEIIFWALLEPLFLLQVPYFQDRS